MQFPVLITLMGSPAFKTDSRFLHKEAEGGKTLVYLSSTSFYVMFPAASLSVG